MFIKELQKHIQANAINFINYLISPLSVITLPKVYLDSQSAVDICHGKSINVRADQCACPINANNELQLLDNNNNLLAIGSLMDNSIIKPEKVFIKK